MTYRAMLASRPVMRALGGALIGRLPTGMAALAIALLVRDAGGSFGLVGAVTAVYGAGAVVGGPLLARLCDRRGQTAVLAGGALVSGAGFVVLATADPSDHAVLVCAAAVAGFATPPLEPALRALWPALVGPENLRRAYALDAASQELVFVGGPLVVSVCVAVASPAAALVAAATLGAVGTALLATTAASREWRPAGTSGDLVGALRSRGVVVLVTGLTGAGASVGGLSVLAVAYAERHQVTGGAGTLMALYAFGGFLGGLLHGARHSPMPARRQLVALAWYLAACCVPLALVPGPAAMAMLCALAGSGLAPTLAVAFAVIDDVAAEGTITEAFAWLIALFGTGIALGATVVGVALDSASPASAAALLAVMAAAGAAVLTVFRARLAPRLPAAQYS